MIVVGTTVAPYKSDSGEHLLWLEHAEKMVEITKRDADQDLIFFVAMELDSRGYEVHEDLGNRLEEIHKNTGARVDWWTFSLNDNTKVVDGSNRLVRICTGRNLVQEFALREGAEHILFLDSDNSAPPESIPALLEMDAHLRGGNVPVYCLGGKANYDYRFMVEERMNTAGFLMVSRDVFRKIRWRSDHYDNGGTDDSCYQADARDAGFGETLVRMDIVGKHNMLTQIENRGHHLERYV